MVLCAAASFLFYRSAWGMLAGIVLIPIIVRRETGACMKKRTERLTREFETAIQSISGAIGAGYSLERAFRAAEEETRGMYGEKSVLAPELSRINKKTSLNEPVEELFYEYAQEMGTEDMKSFAEIMRYAKRSGGNMSKIIRSTAQRIGEKSDVMREIENTVASRRMEQKLLNFMLPGILLFMSLSSPDYMGFLYTGIFGAVFMTICLFAYTGVVLWSERIIDIKI